MNIMFGERSVEVVPWTPAMGCIGQVISYDTETTAIGKPDSIPDLVLASVFNGEQAFLIHRDHAGAFWQSHGQALVFMHTAAFDLEVTTKQCGFEFHDMVSHDRILDIGLLHRLYGVATAGQVPHKWNLALLSEQYLGVPLDKDVAIRLGFDRYLARPGFTLADVAEPDLTYAAKDAIATFLIGVKLKALTEELCARYAAKGRLSHNIQLRADIALRAVEHAGVMVDSARVREQIRQADRDLIEALRVLQRYGYYPGKKGNRAQFDHIVRQIETELGASIPVCPNTRTKSQAELDLHPIAGHEFVRAFLDYQGLVKMKSTFLEPMKAARGRLHPHYNTLVVTGRTSCSNPNIQQFPRAGDIRECIVASPGHVFLACDYKALELCTLAQILVHRYGQSRLCDLINAGMDPHKFTAAEILHKPMDKVSKAERQKAKAVNFGLPGGMGSRALMEYARASYGVTLSEDEAQHWRDHWLELFPEMKDYLKREDGIDKLARILDLTDFPSKHPLPARVAAMILVRISGGANETRDGKPFTPAELAWAWGKIGRSPVADIARWQKDIAARKGSRELQQALFSAETVVLPTGRVRANCSFTEARNTPFQGLAADGAKLALYDLVRAGFRVVAFIHDEVLVELPESSNLNEATERIAGIMVTAMRNLCPDVRIEVEYAVMRRWDKNAKAVYDNAGRLVPFEDAGQPDASAA